MLAREVVALLVRAGDHVTALSRADLDVTDPKAVIAAVRGHDVVVNCAAWTAVDAAETHEAEAFAVNALGPAHLAAACRIHGARLVQVSTDFVFDGELRRPYPEDHPVRPLSAYGRTKAAGEWAATTRAQDALVVRTAWLYGAGPCFPRTVADRWRSAGALAVVDDQVGQPTWAFDVAEVLVRLVRAGAVPGIYHATSSGSASWWEFACRVVAALGGDPDTVARTSSEAFVRPARRPAYSVLGHGALRAASVPAIGPWQDRWAVAARAVLSAEPVSDDRPGA